jgi:SAM-dependent methyltransferase
MMEGTIMYKDSLTTDTPVNDSLAPLGRKGVTAASDWRKLHALFQEPVRGVSTDIATNDTMFVSDKGDHYMGVGQSALRCIKLALLAAGKESIQRILDLPCGHGRVLRVLHAAFPDAQITACDLDRDGVDFCARTFGAAPVYSEENPKFIRISDHFDLIWCGSLLTHVDRYVWPKFLRFFESRLAPGGLCVFTVHGRHSVRSMRSGKLTYSLSDVPRILDEFDRDGFGYQKYPTHTLQNYGISLSSPSWVMNQILEHTDLRVAMYTETGWDNHQDVVACVR